MTQKGRTDELVHLQPFGFFKAVIYIQACSFSQKLCEVDAKDYTCPWSGEETLVIIDGSSEYSLGTVWQMWIDKIIQKKKKCPKAFSLGKVYSLLYLPIA